MSSPAYLTRTEAADYLRVSAKTIDRRRKAGEFDEMPVGSRAVRLTWASMRAYELRRRVRCAPKAERFAIPRLDQLKAEKITARAARHAEKEQAE